MARAVRAPRVNLLVQFLVLGALVQLSRVFVTAPWHLGMHGWGGHVAVHAGQRDVGFSDEWIDIQGTKAKFGARTPFKVSLAGAPDLAASWLYGDDAAVTGHDAGLLMGSVGRLAGWLGRATSSINLFGAIRDAGKEKFLEIGTFGDPRANIRFATGMDIDLPVFSLNVTGELRIVKDEISERRSSASGWVSIEVQGEVPNLAGITLPEEVLRAAAREACRQTCAYASRKLEVELSEDFAAWRAVKVRRERQMEIFLALEYRFLRDLGLALPHPFHFFRLHVVLLNGLGQAFLCFIAAQISGNPLASLPCFLISFLNRFQTSRLGNYTSSDLRELWGIPLLWIQTYLVWRVLLTQGSSRRWLLFGLVVVTFAFIVSWQFSPFLLLLQATALYFVNIVLGFDSVREVFVDILNAYIIAMVLAVAVHFGSPYLLTSPFFFQLVALKTATSLFWCHRPRPHTWSSWICRRSAHVMEGLVAVLVFLLVRKLLAPFATADTHVYEILCTKVAAINDVLPASLHLPASKLPSCAEPSFNANLYLIMGVFKLLEWSSARVYLESTAAPAAAATCLLVFIRCWCNCLERRSSKKSKTSQPSSQSSTPPSKMPNGTTRLSSTDGGLRRRRPAEDTSDQTLRNIETEEDIKAYSQEGDDVAVLFFVVQSLLFLVLGCLVNRLRVAFGPPMMVLAAALWGTKLFPSFCRSKFPGGAACNRSTSELGFPLCALLVFLLVGFAGHVFWMARMLPCINDKEGICQHMDDKVSSDGDLADLYDWFNNEDFNNTPVLASMNLAGSMRAFTNVPMIIHPHPDQAQLVIFEYSRCFFTPYKLDDKRKNCNEKKHQTEDLMCIKLHARSRFFKLVFMNGNYAVFRLRKEPLPGSTPKAAASRNDVILFHDLVLDDRSFSAQLVQRRSRSSSREKSILEMTGPGARERVGLLMCEAAVAAKSGGHRQLSVELWERARQLAPLGQCFCFFGLLAGWEILVGLAARRCGAWRLLRFVAMIVLGSVACGLRVWYTGGTAIDNMDPHSTLAPAFFGGLLLTVVSLTYTWCRRATFLLWIACSLGVWRCAFRVPDLWRRWREWKSSESITVADGLTQRNSESWLEHLPSTYGMMIMTTMIMGATAMNNMACAAGLGAIQGVLPRDYYQHAINALDQAVRIDPGNVLYWRNAVALMSAGRRGDASRAAATWQQLVAMDPQGAANPPGNSGELCAHPAFCC
eukprot:Skav208444  [mRNA]  locus=scaffold1952:206563:244376:- [translate_table: standard]